MVDRLPSATPRLLPPLDPEFRPSALRNRAFRAAVAQAGGVPLSLALERAAGNVAVFHTLIFAENHPQATSNFDYVARLLKFLLWQRGAWRVSVAGSRAVTEHLAGLYAEGGARAFDAQFLARVYEQPRFVVQAVPHSELPEQREASAAIGGHWEGCRIGFDAGGSDRKVAAVIDGKQVFSCEVVWDPKSQSDPQYHFDGIDDSIRRAAEHLPRIDAIGVSSAGIYLNNRTMVASLFRKVPEADFRARISGIYPDIAKKWGDVPLRVENDGDVTALAGALELGDHSVLGLALGTSLAAGYIDARGRVTGWLNELAFAPVDDAAHAVVDHEWSGDRGTGVNYLSQEAVIRLAERAGLALEPGTPGSKLKSVQNLVAAGHPGALAVFDSLGVYLGYGLLHFLDFYAVKHLLLLGRVTSGEGGQRLLEKARGVLDLEAPELSRALQIHLPDEATRRVGQAIAAASLPRLNQR